MNDTTISITQLNEIAGTVMHATEAETLEKVLQRIADAARNLIRARYAALGVPDGEGGLRFFMVSGMSDEEVTAIDHPPVGLGLIGAIMHERTSIVLDDMHDDPRAVGFPENHPEMNSMLGVPILVGGHLYGMFYLADHEDGRPFTLEDQWLLETLAGYAALAIAGSQVRDQQRRLTLLEERQRIGMELHDGIIQSLYAVGMYLDLMRHTDDIEGKNLKHAIDGLNDVIEDIRSYIMNLRTTKEKTRTMRQTVREVLARLYLPADLVVHLDVPDRMPPFDQDTFDSLCMIVVEALSNTVRHADANSVTVRCSQDPRFFTLMIKDDGCGFEPDKLNGNAGLGLRNMRERARLKGGAMDLNSQPQKGTTLRIVVPLDV